MRFINVLRLLALAIVAGFGILEPGTGISWSEFNRTARRRMTGSKVLVAFRSIRDLWRRQVTYRRHFMRHGFLNLRSVPMVAGGADSTVLLKGQSYKDSVETSLRTGIDGALATVGWIDSMIARGFGWSIGIGTGTTPVLGGGALTVFDPDQPMLVIDIPTGKSLVVFNVQATLETPLLAADDDEIEFHLFVDQGALSGATATEGTVEAPWNMRLDVAGTPGGAGVTIVSAITTNLTAAPTEDILLFHKSQVADVQTTVGVLWGDFQVDYQPKHPRIISGQSTFVMDWGGTVATSGFAVVEFLVFDSTKVKDLT